VRHETYGNKLLEQLPLGTLGVCLNSGIVVLAVLRVDFEERCLYFMAERTSSSERDTVGVAVVSLIWIAWRQPQRHTICKKMSPIG
jgi:hypothetical protein